MNIRNFLSNIFSSSKKDRATELRKSAGKTQDDNFINLSHNVVGGTSQQDEDLLSNLRRSKLFFDDMDMHRSPPRETLHRIEESNTSQQIVHDLKNGGLTPVGTEQIMLTTPSKLERREFQQFSSRPNFSDFLNSLKKSTKKPNEGQASSETSQPANCIFFDKRNQHNQVDEPSVMSASRSSVRSRSFVEEQQQQHDTANDFSVNGVLDRIPSSRVVTAAAQVLNSTPSHGYQNNSIETGFVVNSAIRPQSSSRSSSKSSSRVRGSSSKKKAMFVESPRSTCSSKRGEAMIAEAGSSSTVFPQLEQSMLSSKYQPTPMLVKEDVDGENEGIRADQAQMMSDDIIEQVADDQANSEYGSDHEVANSGRYQDCMSTRAEPPTQAKNRSNSFYFDESAEKQTRNSNKSFIQRCSSASSSSKAMSIESPGSVQSANKLSGGKDVTVNNIFEGVSVFNGSTAKESNSQKSPRSEYKCKSSGSSPSRTSLNSFHKQLELMVDKSELLPSSCYTTSKSAQKVPSPIKEVEEFSLKGFHVQEQQPLTTAAAAAGMEVLEVAKDFETTIASPKLRQKSVKFNYEQTPCGGGVDDAAAAAGEASRAEGDFEESAMHHSKVHDKLLSRKPTPYNPFKQAPQSYLARQNKFLAEEGEQVLSQGSPSSGAEQIVGTVLFKNDVDERQELEDSSKRNNLFQQSAPHHQPMLNSVSQTKKEMSPSKALTTQKKPTGKCTVALKKSDFIAQMNATAAASVNGTNLKKGVQGSQSNGFNRAETISNNRRFNNATAGRKEGFISNKKKPTGEEQTLLSDFQKESHGETASNPLPRSVRGTIATNVNNTAAKAAYKNCVFCKIEVKAKEEVKILPCSHKSHVGCQPKDKNLRCPRCNSNNMMNKYRPE